MECHGVTCVVLKEYKCWIKFVKTVIGRRRHSLIPAIKSTSFHTNLHNVDISTKAILYHKIANSLICWYGKQVSWSLTLKVEIIVATTCTNLLQHYYTLHFIHGVYLQVSYYTYYQNKQQTFHYRALSFWRRSLVPVRYELNFWILFTRTVWFEVLRKRNRCRVFENRILGRIAVSGWAKVMGKCWKLDNKELHNLCSQCRHTARMIRSRKMRKELYAACVREFWYLYRTFVGECEGRRNFRRFRCTRQDSI